MPLSREGISKNFVTRELCKASMKRSNLRNKFLIDKSEVSRKAYTT